MGNFLGDLGAAFRGQQDYQTFLNKQEEMKLRIQADKLNLAEIQDLSEQKKKQRARQGDVDAGFMDYLNEQQPQNIPPPPMQTMPPAQAPVQPPAPGQQSVPMMRPRQMGPDSGMPADGPRMGMPPPPMQGPQGGPGMPPGGPQMAPSAPPGPSPYQTVGGPPQSPQGPQGIPPPPMQPGQPRPNSMTLQDAARFIKQRGITDPTTSVQILEKLAPYLNSEAKQEAAMLKMQLAHQEKVDALKESIRRDDLISADKNASIAERREASANSTQTRQMLGMVMAGIAQQNANTRASAAGDGVGGKNMDDGAVEAAAWNYLLKGQNPPARGGMYQATMRKVSEIAKENKMSVQELTSASADVKTKLAAKKNFEVRAQNMERAENQILSEIPVMEDAMKSLDLSKIPAFAKGGIAALRALGDPRVTTLDQAAETVFNEFEGIRTGNPGTLNVSDVANAKHSYENAKTPQEMAAAIAGMRRIMKNAKGAMTKTRKDIMTDINDEFKKEQPGTTKMIFSSKAELEAALKSGKIKKGDTFNDPSGQPHTVN